MLTKQLILAVLQGLPASSLPHLAEPYRLFCERIESALKHEVPPLPALNYALTEASPRETRDLIRTLKETLLIQDQSLPSLSKRQKEVLVALRLFGPASCAQLARTLSQDRSHTHKRLATLMASGLVGKSTPPYGIFYFAISSPLPQALASDLDRILENFTDSPEPVLPPNPFEVATHATIATYATSATFATAPHRKNNNTSSSQRHVFSASDALREGPPRDQHV